MVSALEEGRCVVCTHRYWPGDELELVAEGWAHEVCAEWIRTADAELLLLELADLEEDDA